MSTKNNEFSFSFLKGYSFLFEEGSNTIETWFSSLTGLEKVRVNGELIVEQRNLSTDSSNNFKIEGAIYRTNLEVKNLFKGPFICSLFKNEKLLKQQKLIFPAHSQTALWYGKFWFYLVIGALIGITSSIFNYSLWIGLILLTTYSIFVYKKGANQKPIIEEINVEDI